VAWLLAWLLENDSIDAFARLCYSSGNLFALYHVPLPGRHHQYKLSRPGPGIDPWMIAGLGVGPLKAAADHAQVPCKACLWDSHMFPWTCFFLSGWNEKDTQAPEEIREQIEAA